MNDKIRVVSVMLKMTLVSIFPYNYYVTIRNSDSTLKWKYRGYVFVKCNGFVYAPGLQATWIRMGKNTLPLGTVKLEHC